MVRTEIPCCLQCWMCTPEASPGQVLWWQMRKEHVIWLLERILGQHQQCTRTITLRNDNGSQFIAHAVREYLQEKQVVQEFIDVATPEENCFIEAYHSIIQREPLEPRQFESIGDGQAAFERWKLFYNERRRHDSLGGSRPAMVWEQYDKQKLEEVQPPIDVGKALYTGRRT